MRRIPIDDPRSLSLRITPTLSRLMDELADRLNDADKPRGFPMTDVSKSKSTAVPRHVSHVAAGAVAVAMVLDMLESREVSIADLLRRFAMLSETDPARAELLDSLRIERREAERLSERGWLSEDGED